jgi:hypothetical protein
MKTKAGSIFLVFMFCLAIVPAGTLPAAADVQPKVPEAGQLPAGAWGNSAGRTGCNATTWGKSDTSMGCAGINNNSKCLLLPCKYCRK